MLIPFLTGGFIDTLIYGGSPFIVFFCLVGVAFAALFLNIWTRNMIHNIARKKELDLQIQLLSAFQSMAPSATDGYKNGEVAMKFFRDTGMASLFLSNHYPILLGGSASILLALIMVVYKNSSFPVFLNCSRESREVPEFIVPTLIEKNTNFFG